MKLYVCWGTFPTPRPGGHPCGNAYHALKDAGYEPEVKKVYGLAILPKFMNPGRKEVRELTGRVGARARDRRRRGDQGLQGDRRLGARRTPPPPPISPPDRSASAARLAAPAGACEPWAGMRESSTPGLVWASLGIIYVVWGSTYLAIRVMVETMPPLIASGLRFTLAGVVFALAVWLVGGAERLRASPRSCSAWLLVGLLLCLGGNGLVSVAEQDVPSGLAALVIGSVPLWVILLRTLHGDRVPVATLLGRGGRLRRPDGAGAAGRPPGRRAARRACCCWSPRPSAGPPARSTHRGCRSRATCSPRPPGRCCSAASARSRSAWRSGRGPTCTPPSFSTDSILAFVYLVLIGSLLAYTAYTWLLRNVPISKVATYAYVNPVIAILLGWLILDEEVTLTMVVGAAAIVLSVADRVDRRRELLLHRRVALLGLLDLPLALEALEQRAHRGDARVEQQREVAGGRARVLGDDRQHAPARRSSDSGSAGRCAAPASGSASRPASGACARRAPRGRCRAWGALRAPARPRAEPARSGCVADVRGALLRARVVVALERGERRLELARLLDERPQLGQALVQLALHPFE